MNVLCENCGTIFDKKAAEMKRTSHDLCSKKCTGEFKQLQSMAKFYSNATLVGDCLEWLGATNAYGYGVKRYKGKPQLAHRVSYDLSVGDVGDKLVCHRCDNPKCINPLHLFLGTHQDNMNDMRSKGRSAAKLSFSDIDAIRASPLENDILARRYGVSERTIRYAKHKDHWKPLPQPPQAMKDSD